MGGKKPILLGVAVIIAILWGFSTWLSFFLEVDPVGVTEIWR